MSDLTPSPQAASVPLRAFALELTKGCNLRCGYCYYADRQEAYDPQSRMSEETAFRSVDLLLEQTPADEASHLHFFGGEPLLHFTLLQRTAHYALRRAADGGRRMTFEVTTNGTRFHSEVIAFLNEHLFQVGVSFDGPPEIQDAARPGIFGGSYAQALPGIQALLRSRQGTSLERRTHCSVVVSRRDCDLVKIVKHLEQIGFRKIILTPATDNRSNPQFAFSESDLPQVNAEFDRLAADYEHRLQQDLPVSETWFPTLMGRLLSGERKMQFCEGGMDYLGVAADGKLHLCYRFFENDEFAMGDVQSGVQRGLTQRLLDLSLENRPVCSKCWARYFCGGGCHHDNVMAAGGLGSPNPVTCEIFRNSMDRTLEIWGRLSKAGKIGGRSVKAGNGTERPASAPIDVEGFSMTDVPRKTAGCHVRDLGRESIVYEPISHEVAVLNATAAFIYERCDGTRTVAQIAEDLQRRFAAPLEVLQRDLQKTLLDLRARHLLGS